MPCTAAAAPRHLRTDFSDQPGPETGRRTVIGSRIPVDCTGCPGPRGWRAPSARGDRSTQLPDTDHAGSPTGGTRAVPLPGAGLLGRPRSRGAPHWRESRAVRTASSHGSPGGTRGTPPAGNRRGVRCPCRESRSGRTAVPHGAPGGQTDPLGTGHAVKRWAIPVTSWGSRMVGCAKRYSTCRGRVMIVRPTWSTGSGMRPAAVITGVTLTPGQFSASAGSVPNGPRERDPLRGTPCGQRAQHDRVAVGRPRAATSGSPAGRHLRADRHMAGLVRGPRGNRCGARHAAGGPFPTGRAGEGEGGQQVAERDQYRDQGACPPAEESGGHHPRGHGDEGPDREACDLGA